MQGTRMVKQATVAPVSIGQLVNVQSYGDELPGTVSDVRPMGHDRWEVHVEVLAAFGVGSSRHVMNSAGHEMGTRTELHGLACA